jgi:hypothetical protein
MSLKIKIKINSKQENHLNNDAIMDIIQFTKQRIDSISEKNRYVSGLRNYGNSFLQLNLIRRINNWINPRQHIVRFVFSFVFIMSLVFTLTQMFMEGVNPDIKTMITLFFVLFIGEALMILLAFFLFNKYLNLIGGVGRLKFK